MGSHGRDTDRAHSPSFVPAAVNRTNGVLPPYRGFRVAREVNVPQLWRQALSSRFAPRAYNLRAMPILRTRPVAIARLGARRTRPQRNVLRRTTWRESATIGPTSLSGTWCP